MTVKYSDATKVKAFIGDAYKACTSDADINIWIEEAEGIIDTWLKIGSGTGGHSLTFSAAKKPHLILELAATALAASIVLSHSSASAETMESAVLMMQNCIYWYEESRKILLTEDLADFIIDQ